MTAFELDRRLRAAGSTIKSLGAHPGYASTNLQSAAVPTLDRWVMVVTNALLAQDAEIGALAPLYAATQPGLEGGTYVGPQGLGELRGHPGIAQAHATARDRRIAERLWEVSEELTGVSFELGAGAPPR